MAKTNTLSRPKRAKIQTAVSSEPVAEPVPAEPIAASQEVAESADEAIKAAKKAVKMAESRGKKPKLIRDSFTLPESDYAILKELKDRCLASGLEVKKSEVLRVALIALAKQSDSKLLSAVNALPRIKTGRPTKK